LGAKPSGTPGRAAGFISSRFIIDVRAAGGVVNTDVVIRAVEAINFLRMVDTLILQCKELHECSHCYNGWEDKEFNVRKHHDGTV